MSAAAVGLCLDGRYILLEDDTTLPIVAMMDTNGDDTEDSSKVCGVVFEWPTGGYGVQDVRVFDDDMRIKVQA